MATFGDIKISTINGGPLSGMRNAVINGNFAINQRGVSGTVTLAAGAYGHDRFKAGAGGCTYTFATSQNVTTLTITAGTLIQVIEGANLLTDTYTLTFTGTAQGKIGAGSFSASGVTGSVTGGTNLNVEFNTGTVSLVQLERGSVATPFEFRSIGQEEGLCMRYYFRTKPGNDRTFGSSFGRDATRVLAFIHFPVPMRTFPTALEQTGTATDYRQLNQTTGGGDTTCSSVPTLGAATLVLVGVNFFFTSGIVIGSSGAVNTTSADAFLGFTAEL